MTSRENTGDIMDPAEKLAINANERFCKEHLEIVEICVKRSQGAEALGWLEELRGHRRFLASIPKFREGVANVAFTGRVTARQEGYDHSESLNKRLDFCDKCINKAEVLLKKKRWM